MAKISTEEKAIIRTFIQANAAVPVGVDLSKDHFQICYREPKGAFELKNFQLNRQNFITFVEQTKIDDKPMCIAIEACGACNFWARYIQSCGHKCKILHTNKVKSYIGGNKNDRIDALGIYQCLLYSVRSIKAKSPLQAAATNLLSARRIAVKVQKQLFCAARGMLYEQGIACNLGKASVRKGLDQLLAKLHEQNSDLLPIFEAIVKSLNSNIAAVTQELDDLNDFCAKFAKHNDLCSRLMTIPGIGPISAVAMYPALSEPDDFPDSRHFASYAGVAPKNSGTGGTTHVTGTIEGNRHIRRALYMAALGRYSRLAVIEDSKACRALKQNKSQKVLICAIANRMARAAWAIAKTDGVYDASKCKLLG